MGDLTDNPKARLRRELATRRHAIAASELASKAEAACARVVASPLFERARHVVLYASSPSELDTRAIEAAAHATGRPTYYPRVEGDGLTFRLGRRDELRPGRFGIAEPAADAAALDPAAHDVLVIVPGVGFDRHGHRLGTGRGYYDRTLPALSGAERVGLTIEALLVDAVPVDPWDVAMDAIATERECFLAGPGAGADLGDQAWS